jgi:hypothetical protein
MLPVMGAKLRAWVLILFALAPSGSLAWNWRAMPQLGLHHDDAVYLVSARSLAEGNGYRIASLPGQPFQTKYPPVLPFLLAGLWKLGLRFPEGLPAVALLAWLMLPPYLILARAVFRDFGFEEKHLAALTLLAATHPIVCLLATVAMSDLLFLWLLLAAILLAERAHNRGKPALLALAAGGVAALAYLTRSAALPLAVTSPACFLYRRQFRRAFLFLCGMLPAIVGWQAWTWWRRLSTVDPALLYYTDYMGLQRATVNGDNLLRVVWINLDAVLRSIGNLVALGSAIAPNPHVARLLAIAAIAGIVRLARRSSRLQYPAAAAGMAASLLVYHYTPDERLCLPLFPLVLMGFWTEATCFAFAIRKSWRSGVAGRVAACLAATVLGATGVYLAASYAVGDAILIPETFRLCRSRLAAHLEGYRWLRLNTAPDASIYAYDDPLLYLYTGRRALGLTMPYGRAFSPDPVSEGDRFASAVPRLAREHGLDYLFLTKDDFYREQRAYLTLRAAEPEKKLAREFASGEAVVLRCLRE